MSTHHFYPQAVLAILDDASGKYISSIDAFADVEIEGDAAVVKLSTNVANEQAKLWDHFRVTVKWVEDSEPTSSASMGEPPSEAEQLRAENAKLLRKLELAHKYRQHSIESRRNLERKLIGWREAAEKAAAERDAATLQVGVLEGQLATAQAELEQQRWYGEQLQTSIDGCSGNHEDIQMDEEPSDA